MVRIYSFVTVYFSREKIHVCHEFLKVLIKAENPRLRSAVLEISAVILVSSVWKLLHRLNQRRKIKGKN